MKMVSTWWDCVQREVCSQQIHFINIYISTDTWRTAEDTRRMYRMIYKTFGELGMAERELRDESVG